MCNKLWVLVLEKIISIDSGTGSSIGIPGTGSLIWIPDNGSSIGIPGTGGGQY